MEEMCVNIFKNICEDARAQAFTELWIQVINEMDLSEPTSLPCSDPK